VADAGQPVEFTVATKSLDGDPQPANGTVAIYALQQPAQVERAPLQRQRYWWGNSADEPKADPSNPDSWELGAVVAERAFTTDAAGKTQIAAPLKAGIYRRRWKPRTASQDGHRRRTVQVIDPRGQHYGVKLPNLFAAPKWSVEPGEKFSALWGTGYKPAAHLSNWSATANRCRATGRRPTDAATGRVAHYREDARWSNVADHLCSRKPRLLQRAGRGRPWSNKKLALKWESFRSKLMPARKNLDGGRNRPDAKRTAAEMVATLYDASLDQYLRITGREGSTCSEVSTTGEPGPCGVPERQARFPTDPKRVADSVTRCRLASPRLPARIMAYAR